MRSPRCATRVASLGEPYASRRCCPRPILLPIRFPLLDFEQIEDLDDARRLELLVQSVVDYAIYLLSVEGRVLTWNSGAERLKGYQAEEIIGRSFSEFYTPEDRDLGVPKRVSKSLPGPAGSKLKDGVSARMEPVSGRSS